MQNFKQDGEVLSLTAPYTRTAGQGALVGAIFGVACSDVTSGDVGEFQTKGVFTLTKVGSQAWAVGDKIYWDNGNKRCTTDATAGMLIGVATAVAGAGSTVLTGDVSLNGTAPAALEGPQAAEADLTDNSGGAAADGTIAVVTAPTALTDNGGGTADATVAVMTVPADLTWHADIENAAANGALVQSSAVNPTKAEFDELAHELGLKVNALNALSTVMKNNFKELTTTQGENRAAIVALTDAVKELATKQNALLAKLRIVGIIATS